MLKKLKSLFNVFKPNRNEKVTPFREILLSLKELEWANVYHDSIRGSKPIEELGLNIGRWAGNYTFFYLLNRILKDYSPTSILELGLGESTKFVSTFIENYLQDCNHVVIEHDKEWINNFNKRFKISLRTRIIQCDLQKIKIKKFEVISYKNLQDAIKGKFEFYIIDGPFGSKRYSRYDAALLIENILPEDNFIILFDDTNRRGEMDTVNEIITTLTKKNIANYVKYYEGNKKIAIICSEKYMHSLSL